MKATSARRTKVNNLVYLHRDRGYRFADRDPDMIELCDIIDKSGLSVEAICGVVSKATGGAYSVSSSTIYNWLNGKTKRPQNYTMTWVGYAVGVRRSWVAY